MAPGSHFLLSSTMEFTFTKRNNRKLLHEGYAYVMDRTKADNVTIFWRCEKRGECKGRLKTVNDVLEGRPSTHSHPPSVARCLALKTVGDIKQRAKQSLVWQHTLQPITGFCRCDVSFMLRTVEPGDVTTTCPQLVISGQNLSCTCQTTNTASPPATVRWEGRDSEKLVKTNVQREDNGTQFTCHVTWAGRVYTSITYTLIVAVEPGSVTTTCPQLLISGQNLSCTCQTTNTASPPATVRWEGRDSEKLVKTNVQREDNGTQFTCHVTWTGRVYTSINYTLLTTNTASPPATVRWEGRDSEKLVKTNVQREDNGTQFTCHVTWAGRVYTSINYTVEGPSDVVISLTDAGSNGSSVITLSCNTTGVVYPSVNFTWSTGVCHNETHAARSSTCTASLHAEDDGKSVTCTAINSNDSRISVSTSVTLRIDGAGNIFILTSDSHSTTSAVLGPVVGAAVAVVVAAVIAILFVVLIKKRRRKIKKAPEKTIRSPPCQDSEFEDHINVVYESSDTAGPKSSSTTSHWNKQVCTRKYEDIPSEGYYSQIRQMATGKTFAESDRCLTMNLYSN
ncbi:hypothetical protein C0Q70_12690 [Pomacea canaliculata]|uniref:Ig-like domain-containing protein n=1 Tax=Pomacea canaliculata TaxID=400727 RepID=A0A2T7P292_POMCA|nr:hypothetical protein C0Q70_12690 [Pomacea canaliculata]